ncbi:MAG TPA: glycosyltransferase family 4 protein, partial [Acidimicrobiales bacterium]|nr:glycosyltransferase family 4 protein [Acidimicrobiales bacterium]
MHILMYAESLRPEGGIEISSAQIARALADRGHTLDVLYEIEGALHAHYASFSQSVTRRWMSFDALSVTDAVRILPAVATGIRRRPDVIYGHRFRDVVCGRLSGRVAGAPIVCHLRDVFPDVATRRLASWGDRFIAISYATRDHWVAEGLDPRRVDVVHSGIDPAKYPAGGLDERRVARRALDLPPDAFVAVYYGRLDADKGIDVLFEGWRRLGMAPEDARLVLQGKPVLADDPEARMALLKQDAPPGCQWLPMGDDVETVLHAADVVVLPSRTEGLPRTVLEGMASGRPVVASSVGGTPEILTGPFARFLFDNEDAAGLAERLAAV